MTNCYNPALDLATPTDDIHICATDLRQAHHAAALLELMDHYARDPAGGGSALPHITVETLVQRLAARTDWVSFLAFDGDRAVGLLNAFEGFSTFAAQPLLNIHDVVVARAWRRRGIARRLLHAVSEAAVARGCCKLTLEVLSGNTPALNAYVAAGFTPYALDAAFGEARLMQCWLAGANNHPQ